MLEPILAQLQKTLYQSVLGNLQTMFTNALSGVGAAGGSPFVARPSAFDDLITAAAQRYDMDPALLKAVVHTESNFSANAVSHAGAKGLMQLMDSTAQRMGVTNPFDAAQNIDGGARFLRQLLDRYSGDVTLALAAYNAGPGAVDRWGGLPPYSETRTYVPRVLGLRDQYREWTA
jgi:soluble lytic murein transglycosylase-like protein